MFDVWRIVDTSRRRVIFVFTVIQIAMMPSRVCTDLGGRTQFFDFLKALNQWIGIRIPAEHFLVIGSK